MTKTKAQWINNVLIWIAIISLGLWMYVGGKKQKTAYIQLSKLYADFRMTKELEAQFTNIENKRKQLLDSLQLELKTLSLNIKNNEQASGFKEKEALYYSRKDQFEQDNSQMSHMYTEQIMKQLSQYVKEYGEEKGYLYIYGADGSGVVMHADESLNITEDVLQFVNKRFNGLPK